MSGNGPTVCTREAQAQNRRRPAEMSEVARKSLLPHSRAKGWTVLKHLSVLLAGVGLGGLSSVQAAAAPADQLTCNYN